MTACFAYPDSAAFGRALPKSKIYAHGGVSARQKTYFVDQVEKITWRYKLAPETVNLPATKSVPEIQVLDIALRGGDLHEDVLRCIDRAVPSPLIFELHGNGKRKPVAAWKRPSEADAAKWVTSDYFSGAWEREDAPRAPLPVALNLGALYEQLVTPLLPCAGPPGETMQARIDRMQRIRAKERELAQIESRLAREKQFNKRVEINAELRAVKKELKKLQSMAKQ